MMKPIIFCVSDYIERNKQTALKLYGDRLDEKRNIKGTKYFFFLMMLGDCEKGAGNERADKKIV